MSHSSAIHWYSLETNTNNNRVINTIISELFKIISELLGTAQNYIGIAISELLKIISEQLSSKLYRNCSKLYRNCSKLYRNCYKLLTIISEHPMYNYYYIHVHTIYAHVLTATQYHIHNISYPKVLLESFLATCICRAPVLSWWSCTATRLKSATSSTDLTV